jgi:hypothetical protein
VTAGPCRCGHNRLSHEVEDAPACVHEGCGCQDFRAAIAGVPTSTVGPTAEQLIAAGKRSESKRIVALSDRIAEQLSDLGARLRQERQDSEERRKHAEAQQKARAEIERLERELAAARALVKGRTPPSTVSSRAHPPTYGEYPCPDEQCPKVATTAQGLSAHRRSAHGYRGQKAS